MCDCLICQQGRRIEEIKKKGDVEEMRELISELHTGLLNMGLDNDYYEALLAGEWPNSERILLASLRKVQEKKR
jgi:hypothetical protein